MIPSYIGKRTMPPVKIELDRADFLREPAALSASWNTQPLGSTVSMRCSSLVTGLRIGPLVALTMPGTSMRAVRFAWSHSKVMFENCGSLMSLITVEKIWNIAPAF